MQKIVALTAALVLIVGGCACSALAEQAQVLTSFYPIYIFALNVFNSIDGIRVDCLAAPKTGCLHDYQLLATDMFKLSNCDALIVCGAGMEQYLDDMQGQFPALPVIDCSTEIHLFPLFQEEHAEHEHEDHQEYNAHTWLDVHNAIQIVETIARESSVIFPEAAPEIKANADAYILRLTALDESIKQALNSYKGRQIVTFHEAFPYFANAYGLEIAAIITEEHSETLSPAQIAKVIGVVRAADVPPLFTEPQYAGAAAEAIAAETGAAVYELDPLVSGEITLDAYERGMLRNAQTLIAAFTSEH